MKERTKEKAAASYLLRVNKVIVILATGLMVVTITVEVIARYIFNFGIPWAEEITNYMLVAITMFGAGLNLHEEKDISLDIAVQRYSNRPIGIVLKVLSNALIVVFAIMLFYHGLVFSKQGLSRSSVTLDVPMFYPFLIVPIGALSVAIIGALKLVAYLRMLKSMAASRGDGS